MGLPIDIIIRVDASKENDSGEYTFQCKALGELVRCKDCKHFDGGNCKNFDKRELGWDDFDRSVSHDWYCADGERKEKTHE